VATSQRQNLIIRTCNTVLTILITAINGPDTTTSFALSWEVLNKSAAVWLQLDLRVVSREVLVRSLDMHLTANPDSMSSCVADEFKVRLAGCRVVWITWKLIYLSTQS
jgi:hypothetical protein